MFYSDIIFRKIKLTIKENNDKHLSNKLLDLQQLIVLLVHNYVVFQLL
jgi:hypothetical protein